MGIVKCLSPVHAHNLEQIHFRAETKKSNKMFGTAMRMGMRQSTRRSMAVCSRITPVSSYANVVPQYTPSFPAASVSAIVSCSTNNVSLAQLVDASLVTLDGESEDEPEFWHNFSKICDD